MLCVQYFFVQSWLNLYKRFYRKSMIYVCLVNFKQCLFNLDKNGFKCYNGNKYSWVKALPAKTLNKIDLKFVSFKANESTLYLYISQKQNNNK